MKIQTKLRLSAWVPALVACIIGLMLIYSYKLDLAAHNKYITVRRIINDLHELNNLARSYILHHPERAKRQFLTEQDSLTAFVNDIRFADSEQQRYLGGILRSLEAMRNTFDKLVFNYERTRASGYDRLHAEVDERLAGQVLIRSREGVSQALYLESVIDSEIAANQKSIYYLVFFLIASTTFPITFILLRLTKETAESFSTLRRGTEIIAAGDLNHRIGLSARDEIGELSGAFDQMTEKLRATTVSRNMLSMEVEERKTAEEELRRQKEWFRVLVSSIGDAVIASDTAGLVIFINPVASSLTGWTEEDAIGKPIREIFRIINEKTRKPSEDIVGRVLAEGIVVNLANHTALIARDGRELPIEDSAAPIKDTEGNLIGVVLVFHDVSEKRRAQEALEESADKLRIVADFNHDWEYWRSPQSTFVYVSPSCERITGYTREEFMEDPGLYSRIMHPDDRERVLDHLREDQSHVEACELEFRIFHRDGEERWIGHACQPVLNAKGEPIGRRASNRDITERKYAEEELRRLNETLEQRVAERTAVAEARALQLRRLALELSSTEERERRQIAQILHDDLQQYLAALRFHIQMLVPKDSDDQKVRNLMELVDQSIQKCRSLSHELSPPVLQQSGLLAALNWLAADMKNKHGFSVEVISQPEAEPGSREIASVLFRSVKEVLFNAVKHSGVDSAVVEATYGKGRIQVKVEDPGKGFDIAGLESKDGCMTGFGLFNIQERITSIGGRFDIDSAPGDGCRVTLEVPQTAKTETREHAEPGATIDACRETESSFNRNTQDAPTKKTKILIADDHAVMCQGLTGILEGEDDFTVVGQAADGREAIRLASELSPDVVLMDVSMPKIDGMEATTCIVREYPDIRIIALSMHDDNGARERMLKAGASAYVYKASPAEELVEAIRSSLK